MTSETLKGKNEPDLAISQEKILTSSYSNYIVVPETKKNRIKQKNQTKAYNEIYQQRLECRQTSVSDLPSKVS